MAEIDVMRFYLAWRIRQIAPTHKESNRGGHGKPTTQTLLVKLTGLSMAAINNVVHERNKTPFGNKWPAVVPVFHEDIESALVASRRWRDSPAGHKELARHRSDKWIADQIKAARLALEPRGVRDMIGVLERKGVSVDEPMISEIRNITSAQPLLLLPPSPSKDEQAIAEADPSSKRLPSETKMHRRPRK